ncbi:MAG: T9SS type A sorting domain-containing protein [Bacteroidetes bacterium]|nr:T9SS type A sorting domain-containing protein [Bacteroidota bacterium]
MKKLLTLVLSCFCLVAFAQQDQPVKPIDLVQSQKATNAVFQTASPFTKAVQKKTQVSELDEALVDFQVLDVDFNAISQLADNAPEALTLSVPKVKGNGIMELDLVKVDIFTSDFEVTLASSNQAANIDHGLHYRGIVKGDQNSVVAISIFENEIMGIVANDKGNLVLGKLNGATWAGEHIFYNDKLVTHAEAFECGVPDDGIAYKQKDLEWDETRSPGDCIRLYIEVDNDIYNDKGGTAGATNYATGLLNEVITLYANESITAVVSQIVVWDTTSPYSSTSSSGMLSDFQANISSFNGDLGQLLSYQASGGIAAGFSGICNSNPDNSLSFSNIQSSYSTVPTYSWSVMVVTHEFGHLWGSRHTHACVWNGNNTAIDGCAGQTEGSCSLPGYPSQGGTIMSYCHLQSVGINFNEGFGPQPGNVIRNSVNNATCTSACGPPSCNDGIQNGDETGVDCGGSSCPACPSCSDGIQNGNETGVDCGGPDCAPCPCTGQNVTLTIVLDNYPEETSWTITAGGTTYASGGTYGSQPDGSTVVEVTCLNDGCYDFNIFDSYGDGICCAYGNGSYVLEDESGNVLASGGAFGSSETTNFCISSGGGDTTPPSAPTNLTASNTTETTTDLNWNASSDNVGVDGYYVYLNGSNLGSVAGTAATITGLSPATTYSFYVTAFDAAANESGASNTVNVTTLSGGGGGCTPGTESSNSFESGWQDWNDGGSDCARVNSSGSWDGSYSIRLRDNSGVSSSMTSDAFDLSEYSSVDVEFYFYPSSMENGEDFWLRYNDGSGWTTVAAWASGSSFNNGSFYVATVTLDAASYNLSSNAQFRFQCDASANSDRIYMDLITISGSCASLPSAGEGAVVVTEEVKTPKFQALDEIRIMEEESAKISLYPNPATNEINLNIPSTVNIQNIRVFAVNGAEVQLPRSLDNNETLNIADLNAGIYFLMIETDTEVYNLRFIKQ